MGPRLFAVLLALSAFAAEPRERYVESVLPSLSYGPSCWSSLDLRNLGGRAVTVEIESHRASGALVPLTDHAQQAVRLTAGERARYRLEIDEETGSAWVKIRELIPSPQLSSVVAVSGTTECTVANELRTTSREVAYPMRNPWFSSDVAALPGYLISVVNTSEHPARVALCYSAGNLYSLPDEKHPTPQLTPICSHSDDIQIPPFGARQFPVEREGNSHFAIKTRGDAIVLQMLHPLDAGVKIYSVDSTIKFGGEASSEK